MLKTEAFNAICHAASQLHQGIMTQAEFEVAVATVLDEVMPVRKAPAKVKKA